MTNPLVAKLENVVDLNLADRDALEALCGDVREIAPHKDIIREGDRPEHVHLVLAGWAARYKILPTGTRQITAFLLPGDLCDMHITILQEMDHSIYAVTPVSIAYLPHGAIGELRQSLPNLITALWWATLVDEAILRSWITSLGRRDARKRLAHLICELHQRLSNVGLAEGGTFKLPLTQEELSDALGLTSVHVNRMLQSLRTDDLVTWRSGIATILDIPRLRELAGFDPNYLHAGGLRPAEE